MNFDYKIDRNSKNENRKIDFSFDSALWAFYMKDMQCPETIDK